MLINNKREKRMYYISDNEYIYFPLIVRSKTYPYFTTKRSKKQRISQNFKRFDVVNYGEI